MKVHVKWGKEVFSDIEVDTTQPPMVFKSQLFTLSGVPPERQKVLIKGGQLKDDDWGKQQPKEGMTIMMMGSADEIKIEAPTNAPKFVEDLPGELQLCLLLLHSFSGCQLNYLCVCLKAAYLPHG
jgi:ubiquitin carboxyl-terminal hydrolase 14